MKNYKLLFLTFLFLSACSNEPSPQPDITAINTGPNHQETDEKEEIARCPEELTRSYNRTYSRCYTVESKADTASCIDATKELLEKHPEFRCYTDVGFHKSLVSEEWFEDNLEFYEKYYDSIED